MLFQVESRFSLDDVIALAEHLKQRHLAQRRRGNALLLHLRNSYDVERQLGLLKMQTVFDANSRTSKRVFFRATSFPVTRSFALYTYDDMRGVTATQHGTKQVHQPCHMCLPQSSPSSHTGPFQRFNERRDGEPRFKIVRQNLML